ncbi:LytR/AlgR family response regulator transcription factor [Reichenbachiella faecimaris]|uniref:LytR/AlgR family response regulator transcription factor n=1 Tax=Reichenbachiella faecimaris TaxID=692418 RepID=UPI001593623E|nr:LytTR family DNA-binding domain-containing protein [Reichenbachiella faecimaris]
MAIYLVLILLYANAFESYLYSMYFVTVMYPVILGTAYFFNFFLVPRFLMNGRRAKFALYSIYVLIVSAHLEIIMIFLAFIYLANYQVGAMHPSILDVSKLSMTLYTIVFAHGFYLLYRKYQDTQSKIEALEDEQKKSEEGFIIVRSDRQNRKVLHKDIRYIESLSDYIKIHSLEAEAPIVSKAKISHIEHELPKEFIRIHRSFLVNLNLITNFNSVQVTIGDEQLPISRSYKRQVKAVLKD